MCSFYLQVSFVVSYGRNGNIIIALWNNNVPANKHPAIADCLLVVKPAFSLPSPQDRFGSGFGKPK